MPIYEYRCGECGFQKEFLQKVSDPPLTDCPECGKPAMSKLVSAAGFQLKGTGWYATDFRNSGAKAGGKTEGKTTGSASESKSESAEGTKSDNKPAAGAGTTPAGSGS